MLDLPTLDRSQDEKPVTHGRPTMLALAALASIGAGALHAAAVGMHAEHRQASLTFVGIAMFQLGWGVAVIGARWRTRTAASLGVIGNAAVVVGWLLSITVGIGFIEGLDVAESAQFSDTAAALLAGMAVLVGAVTLSTTQAGRRLMARPINSVVVGFVAALVAAAAVPGLVAASAHDHDHGGGDSGEIAGHTHDHDAVATAGGSGDVGGANEVTAAASAVVPPVPYDPDLPIDLSGTPGVTLEQQARAENIIAATVIDLPQFEDPSVAEAAGFYSIGDGITGHEHYLNWDNIRDDRILDPDYPESLVFQQIDGKKTLVSAMYMLMPDDTLDDVPDIGGPLMQWHIHSDLCFTDDPERPVLAGLRGSGPCPAPSVDFPSIPMIHVWIVPHECGPFASLDGVGAGQIASGEQRLCDTAHGGH